jgi:hypothetical protein
MTHFTVVRQLLLINQNFRGNQRCGVAACKLLWQPALWRGEQGFFFTVRYIYTAAER